ncbi:MAG: tRNA (N(6)-L-threonylcarbamoyladenosine(37)-C(2))-methylthiotransferase MtaB [Clostridia bacterium]|nr:tRNA (N(6)-L-threonylcarbamoyladenosine(37)-C(2))-methylthiotransferase MtaB [Clostridia bacterium]
MNAYFYTLGCKVNQYETQAMRQMLEKQGMETAEFVLGQPDIGNAVLVINSCTVTGESDRKLRQLLRRCRREHPQAILVLTGCMPQAFPEVAQAFTEPDIVLGNAQRRDLPVMIERFITDGCRVAAIPPHEKTIEPLTICKFRDRTRAFLKIEDGCNRFCSYCIIPYARGRVRSKPLDTLRREVEDLAQQGFAEVVLVGINLTAYGQDLGLSICDAVETVCAVDGICRVRLGSIEPDHMTDAVIDRLAMCEKLCPQFHLALQSGCDATLKRMNRRYTTAQYRTVCDRLRKQFPNAALTTDIMVGFPGETQEEFEASLQFAQSIGFSRIHCFAYSKRAGTPAAAAKDQVPNAEKARRNRLMIEMGERCAEQYAQSLIGCEVDVLLETVQADGTVEGYTDTYIPVYVTGGREGELCRVRITCEQNGCCFGDKTE